MKNIYFFLLVFFFGSVLFAQNKPEECSGIFIPRQQVQRNAVVNPFPAKFEALICFNKGEFNYREDALNILDSVYKIVFSNDNGRFYKISIIGYDDNQNINEGNTDLARKRTVTVFDYFAKRQGTEYIIRRTPSKYYNSCIGEIDCVIKYKMPIDFKWVNLVSAKNNEKKYNDISLESKVMIYIEDDIQECLGKFNDYYYPAQDTTILGKYTLFKMPKGALGSITHTKDTIDYNMTLSYEETLSFEDVTKNYSLIPHQKQLIIKSGFIVIKSNKTPDYFNCQHKENFSPNITIKLPLEEQQERARLKFYAKTYKPNGSWEYKTIPTKREKDRETNQISIIGEFSAFQFDTIFVGKRVSEKDMSDYFYPAKEGEPGAFSAMGGWLKPYKLDKRGSIILKEEMEMVLRRPNTN